jgi:xylulokinase
VAQVILYGGGAKSSLWREIIADVLGRPVAWTQTAETAGLGATMLAGLGSGVFASLDEARSQMRTVTQQQLPSVHAATYAEAFETYRRLEARLLEAGNPIRQA